MWTNRRISLMAAVLAVLCLPVLAQAGEHVIEFRTAEDAGMARDWSVCASAPFHSNLLLEAGVFTFETRGDDGTVNAGHGHRIGTATACARLTNFGFPEGLAQSFYIVFDLPQGHFAALGTCTIASNNVPKRGLVIAGCALKMTSFPADVVGGVATSASTFNPFRLVGFSTGSYWTLQYYDNGADGDADDHGDGVAMRSDDGDDGEGD